MKILKLSLFVVVLTFAFLFSCKKDTQNSSQNSFSIKDIYGKEVSYLNPEILTLVKESLINEGRNEDALKLTKLYDFKTGVLKSAKGIVSELSQPTVVIIDSSKINTIDDTVIFKVKNAWQPQGVYAYAHVQDIGDMDATYQCTTNTNLPDQYCGTTGQGKRLEAFTLQTDPTLLSTRPPIYYALRKPDLSWWGSATWGQETGWPGHSFTNIGLKIWSANPYWHVYYIAHNDVTGWNQPWHFDGQFAGIVGRRFEAFAFQILSY
jgi:hypothetical protein